MTRTVTDRDPSAGKHRFGVLLVGGRRCPRILEAEGRGSGARAVDASARLTTHLAEIDAAESRAIAVQDASAVRELRAALGSARGSNPRRRLRPRANDSEFGADYASYVSAVEREMPLLAAGRSREALAFDRTHVDPAHDALRETLETFAARQEHVAHRAEARADRLSRLAAAFAAKAIVDAHGGDIAVESVANRGTTFRVKLPTTAVQT